MLNPQKSDGEGHNPTDTRHKKREDEITVPRFRINPSFRQNFQIEKITWRSIFTFSLKRQGFYQVDLCLDHTWTDNDMASFPKTSTSVELYNSEWDSLMTETNLGNGHRHWKGDFSDIFPGVSEDASICGPQELIECAEVIQKALEDKPGVALGN
jgi:hypothetical protein